MNPFKIGLIDKRNEKLWNDLNKTHSINVELSVYPNYACESFENNSTILIPKDNICIDSFTHELLHILIRQKELYFGSSLENLIRGNEILNRILSDNLIEHFGNCIDHIKMLPIYLELGFDKKKFINDYDINKCTKAEIKQLKENFRSGRSYYGKAVDFYIGKYIAVKADPKEHITYSKSLNELKKLDSNLYAILNKCIDDWKKMPLEKINFWDDDYHSISYEFYDSLNEWTNGKIFV